MSFRTPHAWLSLLNQTTNHTKSGILFRNNLSVEPCTKLASEQLDAVLVVTRAVDMLPKNAATRRARVRF